MPVPMPVRMPMTPTGKKKRPKSAGAKGAKAGSGGAAEDAAADAENGHGAEQMEPVDRLLARAEYFEVQVHQAPAFTWTSCTCTHAHRMPANPHASSLSALEMPMRTGMHMGPHAEWRGVHRPRPRRWRCRR